MSKLNLKATYARYVDLLKLNPGISEPMHAAVGGDFEAIGILEREMLRFYGLEAGHLLVDVGCGSGRLAIPLSRDHPGGYLGTDVVEDLLAFAKKKCERPDWRFEAVNRLEIPAEASSADMVCFFSVLTHLLHEHSYIYLEEAKRVLKPGGRIVFSFLEYTMPEHLTIFELSLKDARSLDVHPLNVFVDRAGIRYWARSLGLDLVEIRDATDAFIPLPGPITFENGRVVEGPALFGQSVCVLEKPRG